MDQTSIAEGIGGVTIGFSPNPSAGLVNVRQNYIQGIDYSTSTTPLNFTSGSGMGRVPNNKIPNGVTPPVAADASTRRYQINFALGLFTQDKLIPTKFMASQLAIEITLAENAFAILSYADAATPPTGSPSYSITSVNLIPEVLEFDAKYDEMFLAGLREGGVPIKFSSWVNIYG